MAGSNSPFRTQRSKQKVLVVGKADVRRTLKAILGQYELRDTPNLETARRIFNRRTDLDAICLDSSAGNWNTLREFSDAVRQRDDIIPIIITSDFMAGATVTLDAALAAGVNAYLTFPQDRDRFLDRLEEEIHRRDEKRSRRFSDPRNLQAYLLAAFSCIDRLKELEGVQNHAGQQNQLRHEAFAFVVKTYRTIPPDARHMIFVREEATEGGIARVVFNLSFLTKTADRVLTIKHLPRQRVEQVLTDNKHFRGDPQMPLEDVYAGLVENNDPHGYLIKEYIPGGDLAKVLLAVNSLISKNSVRGREELDSLRRHCADVAIERIDHWQYRAPRVEDERNVKKVLEFYGKNFCRAFVAFSYYTDVLLPHGETKFFETAQTSLGELIFGPFISLQTICRNFAATYRNMIFKVSTKKDEEVSIDDIVSEARTLSLDEFKNRIKHVDTHRKYSHLLEDFVEVIDAHEVRLPSEERQQRYTQIIGARPPEIQKELQQALPFMGLYRSLRKTFFVLDRWGPQLVEEYKKGTVREEESVERIRRYSGNINYYLQTAKEWMQKCLQLVEEDLETARASKLRGVIAYVISANLRDDIKKEGFPAIYQRCKQSKAISNGSKQERQFIQRYLCLVYTDTLIDRMQQYKHIHYFEGPNSK